MRPSGKRLGVKYLIEDRDRHGNARLYLRAPGMGKVRILSAPGTPQFWEEIANAQKREAAPPGDPRREAPLPGSLRWLTERYYTSPPFAALDARTRRVRRGILERICLTHGGGKPYRLLARRHIMAWRDLMAETPEAANGMTKALRALFVFACDAGHATSNPARDIAYLRGRPGGFHSWTEEEVARYEACHPVGTRARLALALLLHTGQRRADVVSFGPQHVKDGWLTFTQVKGRRRHPVTLSIPVSPELAQAIAASPSGHLSFLVTEFGKPFTANGFGNRFRKWCDAAGLLGHCSAHGLRKAAAARLAEAGATERQIMAITGHRTSKEVTRYTEGARQKILAAEALRLLQASGKSSSTRLLEGGTKPESLVPLSPRKRPGGTFRKAKPLKDKR